MKLKLLALIAMGCLFLSQAHLAADETLLGLESIVIENFDNNPTTGEDATMRWIVRGSGYIDTKLHYPIVKSIKAWPEALFGRNKENLDLRCLGVEAGFTRQAYNYLEIIPARPFDPAKDKEEDVIHTDADGKKWVHVPIVFQGRIKAFSIWFWGSNFNYYLEVHLKDFTGVVHVLPLGNLNFTGWKNLNTEIPPSIPQSETYLPKLKRLRLEKFMLWTRPTERVSQFWFYLDQMKILTDLFESRYDGDDLGDESFIQETWGTPAK
jgi:hypothetical protein